MNQEEQIVHLNTIVKCRIGVSKVHGVGVFAIRDIKAGEPLYLFPDKQPKWFTVPFGSMNKLRPEVRDLILGQWASIVNGSHFLTPNDACWMVLYVNHSDDPNYESKGDFALKDIKAGEEITENYRTMDNYEKVYTFLK